MEDIELYNFSIDILNTITKELNQSYYADFDEKIVIKFSTEDEINAYAKVLPTGDHCIVITYEYIKAIYDDAVEFCNFITRAQTDIYFQKFFIGLSEATMLPQSFTFEDNIKNMFVNSLTWTYFHELGHLVQKHGFVRDSDSINIQEFHAMSDAKELTGASAVYSHVTEIAADYYGVKSVLLELFRHWKGQSKLLVDSVYIFVCSLTSCFYRFYGNKSLIINSTPHGSHPHPIIRAELTNQINVEFLDLVLSINCPPYLNRKTIVHFCYRAALATSLFWFQKYEKDKDDILAFMMKGVLNRQESKDYMNTIITTWDKILPTIEANALDTNSLTLLSFTDQFRDIVK